MGAPARPAHAQSATIEIEEDDQEIVVPASSPPPAAAAETPPPAEPSEVEQLRAELAALRERLDTIDAERTREAAAPPEAVVAPAEPVAPDSPSLGVPAQLQRWGFSLSGYVQAQYEWSDLSEDQLLQGGVVLNRNRFSIRRGRIRLAGEWEHVAFEIELDGSTTRGPFFGLRRTTVSALLRSPDSGLPPFVELSAGLTEIPFGHEVRQSQRDWLFMERSLGSLAFFRGPLDLGVRAQGGVGVLRYDVAVMGGTPLDDRAGQGFAVDPTSVPDVVGRVGVETVNERDFELAGGVSFLWGTGFHPGQDAVKGRLEWRDLNESGTLDTGEIVAIPGRAATPSLTFERWGVNLDAHAGVRTPIGWTRLFVEATLASNLDRSMFVADPIETGFDVRHLSAYAALTQEIFDWGLLGLRYDYYDPNSDLVDQRRGLSVPADASIHTFSPLVGVRLPPEVAPGFAGRLVFQYDAILDALGRDARGVPADLRNDQFTVRVQGEFR
ncbi:porin [Sandaracinus amylolyticus]|uniref:Phosphate-selective porin O and P n=1 Tax=Sandaracinus amylolyticus TaxID=927083 RepID=A0A0F6W290_9BACT|nr:porin [Sandaracinus amylolyticus]AKF05643.1 phosphate-selective porin O and P [Sandaracinus amylolyticus]